ncbi:MAG: hypothetical protein L0387_23145 [Acidobacteria bacterium]|nr:hypothetical protein [Acidobacteriota bacterium]MCI0722315.1 hypothetical protein [Acidobacteriota bacterium]
MIHRRIDGMFAIVEENLLGSKKFFWLTGGFLWNINRLWQLLFSFLESVFTPALLST